MMTMMMNMKIMKISIKMKINKLVDLNLMILKTMFRLNLKCLNNFNDNLEHLYSNLYSLLTRFSEDAFS